MSSVFPAFVRRVEKWFWLPEIDVLHEFADYDKFRYAVEHNKPPYLGLPTDSMKTMMDREVPNLYLLNKIFIYTTHNITAEGRDTSRGGPA